MKVKKVKLITEEARNVNGVQFLNSTEDQFPYVESAINTLDGNFNWWKDNWPEIEQLMAQYLEKAMSDAFENRKVTVSSRFTVFHGADEKVEDVIWTGPAIVYTLEGAPPAITSSIKNSFGGMYKGKKVFSDGNQLIFLFG
jgi:hypothetical protein